MDAGHGEEKVSGVSRSGELFERFSERFGPRVEETLQALLPDVAKEPSNLHQAMRHAMFPGGKRLRPLLSLLGCEVTGGDLEAAILPAVGLECLHTYSLIHDDLPCMDDDDLRRGRLTVHRAFDEATAVLAGDALQALAFEAVSGAGPAAVEALARAAGSQGMVAGQAGDMEAAGLGPGDLPFDRVRWIHDRKTGALISASLEIGVLAGGGPVKSIDAIREFGCLVGRAFQIADDCLDLTGETGQLGKQPGQDEAAGKLTYPAVMGLQESLIEAQRLAGEAALLAPSICCRQSGESGLDPGVALLQDVAQFIVSRKT